MNKATKNTLYYLIGSFAYLFSQWLMSILVVRLSGSYEEAGVFGTALSITNVLYMVSTFSVRNYQVADVENKFSNEEYLSLRLVTCIGALVMMVIYLAIMRYSLYISLSVVGYMLIKTGEALVDVFQGIYQKIWRLDISCVSLVIRGILNLVFFSLSEWLFRNLVISLLVTAMISFICAFLFDIYPYMKENRINVNFHTQKLINLLLSCLPMFIYGLLSSLVYNTPRIVAQEICGEELFGYYASVTAPTVIMIVAINSIYSPCITLLSEQYSKKEKNIYSSILKIQGVIILISIVAIIGFSVWGRGFLTFVFGDDIVAFANLLLPSVIATALISESAFVASVFTVCKRNSIMALLEGAVFIVELVLSFILIKKYGLQGINYALIISCTIFVIVGYFIVISHLNKDMIVEN